MAPDTLFVVWEQLFCHAMHTVDPAVRDRDFFNFFGVGAIMQSCVAMAKLVPL
jgi:hypothetical protein